MQPHPITYSIYSFKRESFSVRELPFFIPNVGNSYGGMLIRSIETKLNVFYCLDDIFDKYELEKSPSDFISSDMFDSAQEKFGSDNYFIVSHDDFKDKYPPKHHYATLEYVLAYLAFCDNKYLMIYIDILRKANI